MDEFTQNTEYKQFNSNQILETEDMNLSHEYVATKFNDDLSFNDNIRNTNSSSNPNAEKINIEDANTTNCLALTIKKEHRLVAIKNVFIHSLKVTWKVIVSTIALHILKIFF